MELSDVGDRVFAAECIQSSRTNKGRIEYLIKWKGWSHKYDTWEPEKNIIDKRLLKEFHRKQSKRTNEATARRSVLKAKKVSIEGVKRPRGRPPLAETLKRRLLESQRQNSLQSKSPPNNNTKSASIGEKSPSVSTPAVLSASNHNVPSDRSANEQSPVMVKKRRKQGPRGMARLFVHRPGTKATLKSVSTADSYDQPPLSPAKHPNMEPSQNASLVAATAAVDKLGDVAGEQNVMALCSPMWQPASKRVLDSVCVTDVTACSGVTVTVRESSVVDGFFRSHPDLP